MLNSFIGSSQKTSIPEDERNPAGQTNATIPGIRSIAINVLGSVGYGTPKSWRQGSAKAPPGYQLSYMEAIGIVAENLVPSTFISPKILTSPVMPKSIQHIGYAVSEFPGHVKTLLEAERKSEHSAKANLMSTLVKVSDAGNSETAASQKDKLFLSENELAGNLFQFTIAGYDTTANTMAYAITLLAVHPEWQDWIREELDEKLHAKENMEYESTYPKLKRCLVLMVSLLPQARSKAPEA